MNKPREQGASGTSLAALASVVGLALVWSVVWANVPSWEELLSGQPRVPAAPAVPELDLTIPGVPSRPPHAPSRLNGEQKGAVGATVSKKMAGGVSALRTIRAACAEDVKRVCRGVDAEDGNLLACLQTHEQDLSLKCYQGFPKGQVQVRN